jgi:hypothetical protein
MIRRDYILRQIEEFVAMLAKIAGLAKSEQWQEASAMAAGEFQRLTGVDARQVLRMSETELLARLIQGEPTQAVGQKTFMLAALLKANGDLLASQGRTEDSRQYHLKGLQLLLETFGRAEIAERPDFAPTVEAFLTGLRDAPLPLKTNAMLMLHYERTGEFARAGDALSVMIDTEPGNAGLLDFARLFYQRLLGLGDAVLAVGNLPRSEVEARLSALDARTARRGRAME